MELVGGGSRSPVVQNIIATEWGIEPSKLTFKLDIKLSLAEGAAALGARPKDKDDSSETETETETETKSESELTPTLSALEQASQAREAEAVALDAKNREQHELRDRLDRFIGSTRSSIVESSSKPTEEQLNGAAIEPLLEEAEQLVFSATATGDECEAARTALDAKIREISPGYFAAKAAAKAKYEAELAEASAKAKAEKANEESEDHDRRKLRAAKRLLKANKQKTEGTFLTLFFFSCYLSGVIYLFLPVVMHFTV